MTKYLLNQDDFDDYERLFNYSFNIAPEDADKISVKTMYDHAKVYGERINGRLVTSVLSTPLQTNFFGQTFKITSFANVMSAPEFADSRGITRLTTQAITDMYQDKVVLSYLDPFSYDYYRRFSFEQVFQLLKMEIPFVKFAKHPKALSGRIQRFKFSEVADQIHSIFDCHNTRGGIVEDKWLWDVLKKRYDKYFAALTFDQDEKVTGYLIYSLEKSEYVIHDFIYQTPDSFLLIMNFIAKHRSSYKTLVINSSDTNLKPDLFVTDPLGVRTEIEPFMMVRIINLAEFLQKYPIQIKQLSAITIKVIDDLEWNDHIWTLSVADGQVNVQITDDVTPTITVNITTLTKAMFGYQTLNDAFMTGDLVGDLEAVRMLDKIFVKESAQLNGEF